MLIAYFDESGVHGDQSEVTTVAGLLGQSIEWSRLELPWKKRMSSIPKKYGEIKTFHATDCDSLDNNFRKMDKAYSKLLSADLAALIANRNLVAVGGAVYRDDWKYVGNKSGRLERQYKSKYHFCAAMAIMLTLKIAKERANSEPVHFVFAKQPQYQDYLIDLAEIFKGHESFECMGGYSISSPECLIQLQAADFYSYENYRELLSQYNREPPPPQRENLKIISEGVEIQSRVFTIDALHRVADQIDDIYTRRGLV